jgi:hypothetical protein
MACGSGRPENSLDSEDRPQGHGPVGRDPGPPEAMTRLARRLGYGSWE